MAAIRVSEQDKARLVRVQQYLHRNGVRSLEGLKEMCPQCGELMDGLRFEAEYLHCPTCGYEERSASLSGAGSFALGMVIGAAIAGLATYLVSRSQIARRNNAI